MEPNLNHPNHFYPSALDAVAQAQLLHQQLQSRFQGAANVSQTKEAKLLHECFVTIHQLLVVTKETLKMIESMDPKVPETGGAV